MVTIVFDHPWHGSFNKAILDAITQKYDKENKPYKVLDLHKDKFNPVFSEQELSGYNNGKAFDPLIVQYQDAISQSDEIVFIFPIWWSTMPAPTKGFLDKVMLKDFAFNYEGGWNPLLKFIKKATIVTTSDNLTSVFTSSIEGNMIPLMLGGIGIENTRWINCEKVTHISDDERKAFLNKVAEEI